MARGIKDPEPEPKLDEFGNAAGGEDDEEEDAPVGDGMTARSADPSKKPDEVYLSSHECKIGDLFVHEHDKSGLVILNIDKEYAWIATLRNPYHADTAKKVNLEAIAERIGVEALRAHVNGDKDSNRSRDWVYQRNLREQWKASA